MHLQSVSAMFKLAYLLVSPSPSSVEQIIREHVGFNHSHTEAQKAKTRTPNQLNIRVSKINSNSLEWLDKCTSYLAAKIPKTQYSLPISHNNNLDFPLRPILQYLKDSPPAKELITNQYLNYIPFVT